MQQTNNGYKKTKTLIFRLDSVQFDRLEALASAEGFTTLSGFIRSKIFSDLAIHNKLNQLLNLLQEKNKHAGGQK